jgi:S-adenosylmethionine decarboxylase proenzyme
MCTDTKRTMDDGSRYLVRVSKRFLILSLLSSLLLAFVIGRTARILLIVGPQRQWLEQQANIELQLASGDTNDHVTMLPNPVLQDGKVAPRTLYTSKNFNTAGSATINSRFVEASENQCSASEESTTESDSEMDDEVHLPVGQHLLLDIKNVDSSFLSSEDRLANAMLQVVYECGLTLLSYHCHGLQPSGVSCVGVLLESHVSFHTWPSHGVITLDLFTCGPNSLLPIVSTVERLFSVPITSSNTEEPVDKPEAIWAYKVRGFGGDDAETTAELTDLFTFPIGAMTDYKKEVSFNELNTRSLLKRFLTPPPSDR